MELQTRDIATLKDHPQNDGWRRHPPEQVAELSALLEQFGWLRNVVVSSDGYIVAGHGIVAAAKSRGESTVPVVVMAHKHDSPEALKFMVAENTVQRGAETDDTALAALLASIQQQSEGGLSGTGYDDSELDALIGEIAAEEVFGGTQPMAARDPANWRGMGAGSAGSAFKVTIQEGPDSDALLDLVRQLEANVADVKRLD
jgi:hypothetical protein